MPAKVNGLYYITHVDNLASIFEHGILSHEQMEKQKIPYQPVYDRDIVDRRHNITAPNGKSLWDFANFYLNPRNPMMYRLSVAEGLVDRLVVLKLKATVFNTPNIYLSDGNAAHSQSNIYPFAKPLLNALGKQIDLEYWNDADGSKRKIMAESLIPHSVSPSLIECVYVGKQNGIFDTAKQIVVKSGYSVEVICEPNMFFIPPLQIYLAKNLSLAQGDLFFSKMQTLTISVNTKGVMGKGLASRAKYQFPHVYVEYQDLCKQNKITTYMPAVVKTELSLAADLSEKPLDITAQFAPNYFLLFATKDHWREDSKISYITDGLSWLKENYKREGLRSIALPALGCGLGNLEWRDVGPIMCDVLKQFDIQTVVYLPTEKKVEQQYLTKEYLLG